jgi:hypothetical protein
MDEAEAAADDERPAKQRLHVFGRASVAMSKSLGLMPSRRSQHRAADDEGFEAFLVQLAR